MVYPSTGEKNGRKIGKKLCIVVINVEGIKISKIKFYGNPEVSGQNQTIKIMNTDLRNKRNLKIFYELFNKVIPQRKLM